MLYALDLIGVAVFAATGALVAARKRMDAFGLMVLAIVTAVGGGTIRDVLIRAPEVFWIADPTYVIVAVAAAFATLLLRWQIRPPRVMLPVADACGLALFCVLGARKAIDAGVSPIIAVVMGVLTGVAGGVIRDLLANEIPLVLRREIYATAAFVGAGLFLLCDTAGIPKPAPTLIGGAAALALRLAAIRWNLSLPVLTSAGERDGRDDPS